MNSTKNSQTKTDVTKVSKKDIVSLLAHMFVVGLGEAVEFGTRKYRWVPKGFKSNFRRGVYIAIREERRVDSYSQCRDYSIWLIKPNGEISVHSVSNEEFEQDRRNKKLPPMYVIDLKPATSL